MISPRENYHPFLLHIDFDYLPSYFIPKGLKDQQTNVMGIIYAK